MSMRQGKILRQLQERRWRHPKPPKPPVLSEEPPVEHLGQDEFSAPA